MLSIERYRTWIASAAIAGVLALTGCADLNKNHETLKVQQLNKWNLTRIAIIHQLAEQQYKVGDYDKAEETLKEAFAAKTPFAPIYVLEGKIQIEKGNLEVACDSLNQAIRIQGTDPEPYYLLGVLYQRWQKPDVACDYYNQAWMKKPDEARYLLAMVEMKISMGQLDEAQTIVESKLVYFEQSAALHVALARIATLKGDYAGAVKCYREAVTLMPDDPNLKRSYVEALFYAGDFAAAAPLFEDMRKHAQTTIKDNAVKDSADKNNIVMMLGESYMGLRRFQEARNCFQEIIRDQPEDMLAFLNLGQACVQTGDLGLSISAARKVLRTEPDNVQAMILIALVQQKQKKWAEAQETLENAGKIAPTDATVLCMLGLGSEQLGQKDQAVAFYEKAVQAHPKDTWAAELLGRVKPEAIVPVPASVPQADAPAAANTPITDVPAGDPAVQVAPAAPVAPIQVSGAGAP